MFKNITLKNKLAILASLAIILGTIIVEIMAYKAAVDQLDVSVEQRLKSTTAAYNQYVSDWIKSNENALTSFSDETLESAVVTHLKQLRHAGDFDNVFMAYPDGSQKNANNVVLPPDNNDPRKWSWYINAMANPSEVFMANPSIASATGANVVSVGKVVNLFGKKLVLGADVEITDIIKTIQQVILPGKGYMFIANKEGNIFTHADTSFLNKNVSALGLNYQDIKTAMNSDNYIRVNVDGQDTVLYARAIDHSSLATVVVISYDSLIAPINHSIYKQLGVTAILVIICIVVFNFLCSVLFKPLSHVADALEQIASGSGDLTQRIEIDANDEVGRLANGFNTFVGSLQQLILHIKNQAETLTGQADESAQRANQSATELSTQQQEVNMVATAVTEMASATQEIASHAEQTAQSAQDSATSTDHGRSLVMTTRQSITNLAKELSDASVVVSELDQHSQEISTVLATIQGIAEQTNLLALNAAIEAARAGEQGRGFAVVADEVRVLSQRTHTSTEEIKSTIDKLQEITKRAVGLMDSSSVLADSSVEDADKASHALEEINAAVSLISDMASQIATAAEEQTHVTNEITQNVTAIKDVTEQLAVGSDDSLKQANELRKEASDLSSKVGTFKLL